MSNSEENRTFAFVKNIPLMQPTIDNDSCVMLAALLKAHGVTEVVVSPGSRNAPVIVALHRLECFSIQCVIDERCAAFIAMGKALVSNHPVAVVCTSGTALLNFAPAVAEAFYRGIPLIVVSADRPSEWIDQDDSQTLRQFRVMDNIVKHSYDLPAFTSTDNLRWYVRRTINDAILMASSTPQGPVHLNIQIDEPLDRFRPMPISHPRVIHTVSPAPSLPTYEARELGRELASPRKVLIIAGFHSPSEKLSRSLNKLGRLPNVAIMYEAQSNLHLSTDIASISCIDATLTSLSPETLSEMVPDVVITYGGAILSRMVKSWLRDNSSIVTHWHVGFSDNAVDCFQCLERRILMSPEIFFQQLASAMQPWRDSCCYSSSWIHFRDQAEVIKSDFINSAPWSDLKAMQMVISSIPKGCNLHLSNGTAVRYAQLFPYSHIHRIDSNRGVSGIDGCTSTAVGASTMYGGTTLLVTGDMSAQYDLGALATADIPARFRMIVLNNSGGGIFRFIRSTSSLPERDRYLVADVRLPLRSLAEGFGFDYLEASDEAGCQAALEDFYRPTARPAILNLITPPELSADILKAYFKIKL